MGPYCLLCDPGDFNVSVYYRPATDTQMASCSACRQTALNGFILLFGVLFGAVLVLLLFWLWWRRMSAQRQNQISYAWRKFTPHVKLKIMCVATLDATPTALRARAEYSRLPTLTDSASTCAHLQCPLSTRLQLATCAV